MTFLRALATTGIGAGTGLAIFAVDFGISYIPVAPLWQAVIFGTAGIAGSIGLCWLSERAAAGAASSTATILTGRIVEMVKLGPLAKQPSTAAQTEGAAVRRFTEGGAVVRTEGGTVVRTEGGARALTASPFNQGFKVPEGAASAYVHGPARHYGPHAWIHDLEAGRARLVSAHTR